MNRSLLITLGALFFVTVVSGIVIFFANGYTFNPKLGKLQKTGILVVTSEPKDAAVYLDSELKTTTNTTFNFLTPGKYKVRVTKDGFTPWEKVVEVKAELVTRLDLNLFPQVPDLRRLTFTGVGMAQETPDGQRIVYTVNEPDKRGVWVTRLTDRLPFLNVDALQVYKDGGLLDLSQASFVMSPDSTQMLLIATRTTAPVKAKTEEFRYYLLDLDRLNENAPIKTEDEARLILTDWHESLYTKEKNLRERVVNSVKSIPVYEHPDPDLTPLLTAMDRELANTAVDARLAPPTATNSALKKALPTPLPSGIPSVKDLAAKIAELYKMSRWSPEQKRVLFTLDGKTRSYDLTTGAFYDLPKADNYHWYPSDRHIIYINPEGKKEIAIGDFEGTNLITVFSGQFIDSIAYPWTTGEKLVVLTNLNQTLGSEPNLYAINLR